MAKDKQMIPYSENAADIHEQYKDEAVKKSVRSKAIQHPLTILPLTIGGIGSASLLFLKAAAGAALVAPFVGLLPVAAVAAVAGTAIGVGNGVFNYGFRFDKLKKQHFDDLNKKLIKRTKENFRKLEMNLRKYKRPAAVSQLREAQSSYQNIVNILGTKFNESEITYQKYLGTATEVYAGIINNLEEVVMKSDGVRETKPMMIQHRLSELGRKRQRWALSKEENKEYELLRDSLGNLQQVDQEINDVLSQNSSAIALLKKTASSIANINTQTNNTDIDLAMQDLEKLAEKAHKYSIK